MDLVWLRNDLRQLDNPALHHACLVSDEVVAVYLITEKQWKDHNDARGSKFLDKTLASLEKSS